MKLVLLKPVRKIGNIGDVINVKDGFGRNYLIPQGIADRATKENLNEFEARKVELERKNKDLIANAKKMAKVIEGRDFTVISQSSDDGRLFGSVTAKEISDLVSNVQPGVTHHNIIISSPIKYTGIYEIAVHLHSEVDANIIVVIARSDSEAQDSLKTFKESKTDKTDTNTEEVA